MCWQPAREDAAEQAGAPNAGRATARLGNSLPRTLPAPYTACRGSVGAASAQKNEYKWVIYCCAIPKEVFSEAGSKEPPGGRPLNNVSRRGAKHAEITTNNTAYSAPLRVIILRARLALPFETASLKRGSIFWGYLIHLPGNGNITFRASNSVIRYRIDMANALDVTGGAFKPSRTPYDIQVG